MSTATEREATIDDLYRVTSKAELINGRIVPLMPTGRTPNRVASRIFRSLDDHAEATGLGEAYTDNIGFAVPRLTSGRQSFSPDTSFFLGPFPANSMRFLTGSPHFAVEVRSEGDYDGNAESLLAAKRADYFEAGTLVVWDVDPLRRVIRKYAATHPDRPTTFLAGHIADAEPALSGWRLAVDRVSAGLNR